MASAVFVPEAVHCASGLVERSLDATACGLALLDSVSGGRKTKRLKRLAEESREVGCPGITPEPLLDDVRRSTLAVVTAAVGSVALLAADARATFAGENGKIAFVAVRDGNQEIYVMNADGSGQIRLTFTPAIDRAPSWSPDGTKIAFASFRD